MKSIPTLLLATAILIIPTKSFAEITKTLKLGASGLEVKELQILLNKDPETQVAKTGVGSPGRESTYFGSLTKAAVIRFQTKYARETLYAGGISFPTGVVGPLTRGQLRKLYSSSNTNSGDISSTNMSPIEVPVIETITPQIISKSPELLTVSGRGFSSVANSVIVVSDSDKPIGSFASPDSKTISVPFISPTVEKVKTQLSVYKNTPSYTALLNAFVQNLSGENIVIENGTTYVRAILLVKNSGGTSNPVTIKIAIKDLLQ